MRDGCDDPLGKAVRAVLEARHGTAAIEDSAFESTHDWWSFCSVSLKVVEAVVEAQDETVRAIKEAIKGARGAEDGADAGALSEAEKQTVLEMGAAAVGPLVAQRTRLSEEHQAAGRPLHALHLTDMALEAEPGHRGALETRLAALELLMERSGDENHSEVLWLTHRIGKTREELGRKAADAASGPAQRGTAERSRAG